MADRYFKARDYRPGDLVITLDGQIAEFIGFKMDDNFAQLLFDEPKRAHVEVLHRSKFKLHVRHEDRKA